MMNVGEASGECDEALGVGVGEKVTGLVFVHPEFF